MFFPEVKALHRIPMSIFKIELLHGIIEKKNSRVYSKIKEMYCRPTDAMITRGRPRQFISYLKMLFLLDLLPNKYFKQKIHTRFYLLN